MSREKATFRLELEQIRGMFPGKNILTRTDVMTYTGKGRTWLDSHGFKGKTCMTAVQVATILSDLR